MLKIERTEVVGWDHAIRGMRNPMNSWDKSDSGWDAKYNAKTEKEQSKYIEVQREYEYEYYLGPKDQDLMMRLRNAGTDHRKFMRFIDVYVDITAPLYWWKEFDTYKVGTVANSCSTMHKIHTKEFTLEDFSCEHLEELIDCDRSLLIDVSPYKDDSNLYSPMGILTIICKALNRYRERYLETNDKKYWWQMIQLLPSSYNQKRTIKLNYEVLANMYKSRNNHKLDEWHTFCDWIEDLPYSEIITGREIEEKSDDLSRMFIKNTEDYPNPFASFTAPAMEALADLGKSFNGAFDFIFHTDCLNDKNEKE